MESGKDRISLLISSFFVVSTQFITNAEERSNVCVP